MAAVAAVHTLDREVSRSFRVMAAATTLMLALTASAFGWFLLVNNPARNHAADVTRLIEDEHTAMVDEETGLRAYVTTGDLNFLQPYELGVAAVAHINAALPHEITGSRMVGELLDMRIAQDRWLQDWAARARSPRFRADLTDASGGLNASQLATFFEQGKAEFDAYRTAQAKLVAEARTRWADARNQSTVVLVIMLGSLGAVGAATFLFIIRRRRQLQKKVVGPIARLLGVVNDVARGRFHGAPEIEGPAEIVELRDGLADMITSLSLQQRTLSVRADEADRMAGRLRQVLAFAREVSGSLTLRYVLESAASSARTIADSARVRLWLVDEDSGQLTLGYDTAVDRKSEMPELTVGLGVGAVGRAAQYGETCYSADVDDHSDVPGSADAVLAQPLIVGARVTGIIEITLASADERLGADDMEVLETIAGHAATAIEAARLHQRTELLSVSDALTGLANRRRLDEELEMETERALRYARPLTLVMIDVDHFKSINDTFGHARGDAVLQELAAALREQMRTCDTVYRYGGEEFVVLARETDAEGGAVLAERLRETIEHRFARSGNSKVTISLGVSSVPEHAVSTAALVHSADTALYAAKRGGRNRVVVAAPATVDATAMR